MSKALFEKIRDLSKAHRVSIPTLEKALGFGNRSIYKWDSISPSVDKVVKVADYFGVTLDELCGRSVTKPEQPVFGSTEDNPPEIAPSLSASESRLLELFRDLNEEGQEHALAVLEGLAASGIYKKRDIAQMVEA